MKNRLYSLKISIFLLLMLSMNVFAGGGAWQVNRTRGYSSSMGTVSQNVFTRANSGAVLLSVNYFTIIDSIANNDSARTAGLDSAGLYQMLQQGSDSTVLYLDGYIDQFIQVAFFFEGANTLTLSPVTVWQGLSYNQVVKDNGSFRWGLIPTDTLFTDSLNSGKTQMVVSAAASLGARSRVYTDAFLCVAPAMFLQFTNKTGSIIDSSIYIEIYARHKDSVMSGVSGRLQHNIEKSIKPPSSRRRR